MWSATSASFARGAGFAATQYALLSSLYALPGKLVAGGSGYVVEMYGYAPFFCMTAAVVLPVFALIYAVWRVPEGGLRAIEPRIRGQTT